MGYFIGTLSLKDTGEEKNGRKVYVLLNDFGYRCDRGIAAGVTVIAPWGMKTDLASIPEQISWLSPDDNDWDKAAVIHDRAVRLARAADMTMRQADSILFRAMRDMGTNLIICLVFYFWVRVHHSL